MYDWEKENALESLTMCDVETCNESWHWCSTCEIRHLDENGECVC